MKTMTCNDLGGACEMKFEAETFDQIAELSKKHGTEMAEVKDQPHLDAMNKMSEMMNNPEAITEWMESKKKMFEELPEN